MTVIFRLWLKHQADVYSNCDLFNPETPLKNRKTFSRVTVFLGQRLEKYSRDRLSNVWCLAGFTDPPRNGGDREGNG